MWLEKLLGRLTVIYGLRKRENIPFNSGAHYTEYAYQRGQEVIKIRRSSACINITIILTRVL